MRNAVRTLRYSPRTEKTYDAWIKRFIIFHRMRHPEEMGELEITRFLTHLATQDKVSASTQSQALAAVLFLYRNVLGRHCFASHILQSGYDIRTIQELLGHRDVTTTLIHTNVLNRGARGPLCQ